MTDSDIDRIVARMMRQIGNLFIAVGTLILDGPMSKDPPAPAPPAPDTKPPLT